MTYPRATRAVDEPSSTETVLAAIDHLFLYRWPHIAGPIGLGLAAMGASFLAHKHGGPWPFFLTLFMCVCVFLGSDSILKMSDRVRQYAIGAWTLGGGWTVGASWIGPFEGSLSEHGIPVSMPPMLAAWFAVMLLLVPPWAQNRRVRMIPEIAREILAWNAAGGEAVKLPGVTLSIPGSKTNGEQWEAPLKTPRGMYTLEKLRAAESHIASFFHTSVSNVRIFQKREGHEGAYYIRVRRKPLKSGGDAFVVPVERPDAKIPFRMGKLASDHSKPMMCQFYAKGHGAVDGITAGMKGYGKTNYFKMMALWAIACLNSELFLGDMKPGSPDYRYIDFENADLRPGIGPRGAYVYGRTHADIDLIIHALEILCRVRSAYPRSDRAVILVLLDETALYFNDASEFDGDRKTRTDAQRAGLIRLARFNNLVAISRSYGISIHEAVQKGKEKNTGGDARSLLLSGQVMGFHSPKDADAALLSSQREFELKRLPKNVKGPCLVRNMIHDEVTEGIMDYVSPEIMTDMLDRFADGQRGLQADEVAALEAELGDAWRELRRRTPLGNDPAVWTAPSVVEGTVTGPADPAGGVADARQEGDGDGPGSGGEALRVVSQADRTREAVYAALREMGPSQSGAIAKRIGKSPPLVRTRLVELHKEGRAVYTGEGNAKMWTAQ